MISPLRFKEDKRLVIMKTRRKLYFLFLLLFSLILLWAFFLHEYSQNTFTQDATPQPEATNGFATPTTASALTTPSATLDIYSRDDTLPYDKLFITVERQKYKSGDLTLIIPKLNFNEPVQNGTDTASLNKGPGLYDYAQLPGKGDRNVSIAAHRNKSHNGVISEWFFYYIDTLCEGDYIYLTNQKHIYCYEYDQTTIVEENDWSPIYSQGFGCITLTSCEPIGVADHRIIVRGKLIDILPYHKSYEFQTGKSPTP